MTLNVNLPMLKHLLFLQFLIFFSLLLFIQGPPVFAERKEIYTKYHSNAGITRHVEFSYPSRFEAEAWEDGKEDGYIVFIPKKWKEVQCPYHEGDSPLRIDIAKRNTLTELDLVRLAAEDPGGCARIVTKEISGLNWTGSFKNIGCKNQDSGGLHCTGNCAAVEISRPLGEIMKVSIFCWG